MNKDLKIYELAMKGSEISVEKLLELFNGLGGADSLKVKSLVEYTLGLKEMPVLTTKLTSDSRGDFKWDLKATPISYNPLTDEVKYKEEQYDYIRVRIPFKKDTPEWLDLAAKLFECKSEEEAKRLVSGFSDDGTGYSDFMTTGVVRGSYDRTKYLKNWNELRDFEVSNCL